VLVCVWFGCVSGLSLGYGLWITFPIFLCHQVVIVSNNGQTVLTTTNPGETQ